MSKFEKFDSPKRDQDPENSLESREQFGDRALQAAQEVYAVEEQALERKVSRYETLRNIGYTLAVPGSLYIISRFFGVDIEKTTGIDISQTADAAIRLSWAICMLGASGATFIESHLEKKLGYLRSKLGVLSKSEDRETR